MIARVPIRVRLTVAFALATAVVLAAAGSFLEARLQRSLDASINQSLTAQAAAVAALAKQSDSGLRQGGAPVAAADAIAQVLTPGGGVLDATPGLLRAPLLSARDLRRSSAGPRTFERSGLSDAAGPVRLLASPTHAQDRRLFVVVGAPLSGRDRTLRTVRTELIVGGPILILLMAAGGYLLAGAALRPVERMRRAAESLTGQERGDLPLPAARDEVHRLGVTLNTLLGSLHAAAARERRFIADAGHELRTPLTLLRTELELALRRPRSAPELEESVRSAAVETDRLQRLADNLLVTARARDGELPLHLERESIGELLERVAARYQPRAAAGGQRILVHAPGRELAIDRLRMEQAVGNLIENALNHGEGEVSVSATSAPDAVTITVGDRGPGFPSEFIDHAFARFSRADTTRDAGGSGLGLAIVDMVARAHGGTAGATNTEHGADVWIVIPEARADQR
jgi:signal transduction histidine kinase